MPVDFAAASSFLTIPLLAGALLGAMPGAAHAADAPSEAATDLDALSLTTEPAAPAEKVASGMKLYLEGMLGTADRRDVLGSGTGRHDLSRATLDFSWSGSFAPGWRAVLSDRLDHVHPKEPGIDDATINSLREAYLSWQPGAGSTVFDLGRVNLRYGPAYGYNPTDFFRDNALRAVTTTNPISLRETRMGTVVLRGQQLWAGGAISAAFSPKLDDGPSRDGASLDLGATNHRDRGLLVWSAQPTERINSQVLLYKEKGLPAQVGANLTALVGDSVVAHAEWSHGKEPSLFDRAIGTPAGAAERISRNRVATGLTWSSASKLSITAEFQYNGFAMSRAQWNAVGASNPQAIGAYLLTAQRLQELASRKAWMVYATQKSLGLKSLDLTALLRFNADDHSTLAWIELRHHWNQFDLALQLQQQSGRFGSEYGVYTDRRSVQLLGAYYF